MKIRTLAAALVALSAVALIPTAYSQGKAATAKDKGMCDEMMAKHMSGKDMKGMDMRDMPKECQETMQGGDKSAASGAHHAKGTVKKVDAAAGKVTLEHEPIPAIGWPAMTMGFEVKDKKALASLKLEQKVEFDLEKRGSDYVISSIK